MARHFSLATLSLAILLSGCGGGSGGSSSGNIPGAPEGNNNPDQEAGVAPGQNGNGADNGNAVPPAPAGPALFRAVQADFFEPVLLLEASAPAVENEKIAGNIFLSDQAGDVDSVRVSGTMADILSADIEVLNRARSVRLWVSDAAALNRLQGTQKVRVELLNDGQMVAMQQFDLALVPQTQAAKVAEAVRRYVDTTDDDRQTESRYSGRRLYQAAMVADMLAAYAASPEIVYSGQYDEQAGRWRLVQNDDNRIGLLSPEATARQGTTVSAEFQEMGGHIGALAHAYANLPEYSAENPVQRNQLKAMLLNYLDRYLNAFPSRRFASQGSPFGHSDQTHNWRFTDALAGAAIWMLEDLRAELNDSDALSSVVYRKLIRFFESVAFALPSGEYSVNNLRYYNRENVTASNGVWSDANRGHRMRTWLVMAALLQDYNRPLTQLSYWYERDLLGEGTDTSILPEWTPTGALADLNTWISTNLQYTHRYGQSGITPDGLISHHVGRRQDTALIAYGYEWTFGETLDAAEILKDTRWEVGPEYFDELIRYMSDAYPFVLYNGEIDFQAVGRSHSEEGLATVSERLLSTIEQIEDLTEGKVLAERERLNNLKTLLMNEQERDVNNQTLEITSRAYWNHDYLVGRVDDTVSDTAVSYASVRMQSRRTRGAESFFVARFPENSSEFGFFNGHGVLQVKTPMSDYDRERFSWDWHLLPGTTVEYREDALPLPSAENMFGLNGFAGVLSDGEAGVAAFSLENSDPYADNVTANKGYFFTRKLDNAEASYWAMGNSILQQANEDGQDARKVVTVVDQTSLVSDISYALGVSAANIREGNSEDGYNHMTIAQNSDYNSLHLGRAPAGAERAFRIRDGVMSWFHQGDKGYFLLHPQADNGQRVRLWVRIGDAVRESHMRINENTPEVFSLGYSHGSPEDAASDYQYVIVPGVSLDDMYSIAQEILGDFSSTNTAGSMSLVHSGTDAADNVTNQSMQLVVMPQDNAVQTLVQSDSGLLMQVQSADQGALVQLEQHAAAAANQPERWSLTVSNPFHGYDAANDPNNTRGFPYAVNRNLQAQVSVAVNQQFDLAEGTYEYRLKGQTETPAHQRYRVQRQRVEVMQDGRPGRLVNMTVITFDLPRYDPVFAAMYMGAPISIELIRTLP